MKAQLEEQARAEEERRQAEKGDNARERALDQMMGGVLEVKKEDELRKEIPVPMFMQVNECPDKLFTYTRFLEKNIFFPLCLSVSPFLLQIAFNLFICSRYERSHFVSSPN